ncbi:MAG: class I SAM-dependent methyltransferase [Nanoarchaeota archaeon]|nr:class I SAM-dependent methyltransferase [Nanoarchaeota archaeon]
MAPDTVQTSDFNKLYVEKTISCASELYLSDSPVRILDLATGPNGLNPAIARGLSREGIEYELVLSDISPVYLKIGYGNMEREAPSELDKVKCVLADSTNLRKPITDVQIWGKGVVPLEEVLANPEYAFLTSEMSNTSAAIDFADGSFDIVIGCIPYRSLDSGNYSAAIRESARILRSGGYHLVDEMQVSKVQSYMLRIMSTIEFTVGMSLKEIVPTWMRTVNAIHRAKNQTVSEIQEQLDTLLSPLEVWSVEYIYDTPERIPEQTMQKGDIVERFILSHQKAQA